MTAAAFMFISRDFVHVESRIIARGTDGVASGRCVLNMRSFPKPELVWLLETGCRLIVMAMCPEVVSK